jgi:hypothetical protein
LGFITGPGVTIAKAIIDILFYLLALSLFAYQASIQKKLLNLTLKQSLFRNGVVFW